MRFIRKNSEFFQFIRIRDWWYHNGIFFLGTIFAGVNGIPIEKIVWGGVVTSLYLANGYSLNEYYDHSWADRKGRTGPRESLASKIPWFIFMVNLCLAVIFLPEVLLFVFLGGVLSWLYSAPPFRFKGNPILRLLLNASGFSLIFLMGTALSGAIPFRAIGLVLMMVLLFFPIEMIHDLNDAADDRSQGIRTFPVLWGNKTTLNGIVILLTAVIVYVLWLYFLNVIHGGVVILTVLMSAGLILLVSGFISRKEEKTVVGWSLKSRARILLSGYMLGLGVLFFIH